MKYVIQHNPFETQLDLKELAEQIAIGPQEEVLNEMENINSRYGTAFRITPTFRWQPGFYKKLVVETERMSGVTAYKGKVSTYFNNIDNRRWTVKNFRDSMKRIDEKLYYLRQENAQFQDNTEGVVRCYGEFLDKINETQLTASEIYPNMYAKVNICTAEGRHENHNVPTTRTFLVYEIHLKDVVTTIQIGNNPVSIPMGRIELMIAVDLRKAIFNRLKDGNLMDIIQA